MTGSHMVREDCAQCSRPLYGMADLIVCALKKGIGFRKLHHTKLHLNTIFGYASIGGVGRWSYFWKFKSVFTNIVQF